MRRHIGTGITLALMLFAGKTHAGLLPASTVSAVGENFRHEYDIGLESGSMLKPGDYFTIYDFAGFVGDTNQQPAGFTFSSSNSGPTPSGVLPSDDGGVSNLTWTYTGGETIGPADLGKFSAVSHYGQTAEDSFSGLSHRTVGGHLNSNITDTEVPVPVAPDMCHHHVPEPSTLVLLAAGLPVMLGMRKLRNCPS